MSEQSVVAGHAGLQGCTTTFQVTVFRSRKTKQVLFLEAGAEFVDTLFGFLVLPIGTIMYILSQGIQVNPLGGISCIFESVDSSFLHMNKKYLVQPRPPVMGCASQLSGDLRFQQELEAAELMLPNLCFRSLPEVFGCDNCGNYSSIEGSRCDSCHLSRKCRTHSTGPYTVVRLDPDINYSQEGFVMGNIKFTVTDKLEIIPSTLNSSVSLLKKLKITSVDDPESDVITVSITQILQLLHSSLISKTCLNDVFGKK